MNIFNYNHYVITLSQSEMALVSYVEIGHASLPGTMINRRRSMKAVKKKGLGAYLNGESK